jgi:Short C-terminal domain
MPRGRLLGAAAVGGAAYAVGRRQGRRAQAGDDQPAGDQDQAPADDQQQADDGAAQATAQAAPYSDDSLDQLNKLGEMHASGVLTDEEFNTAKAKILGG